MCELDSSGYAFHDAELETRERVRGTVINGRYSIHWAWAQQDWKWWMKGWDLFKSYDYFNCDEC
jgi:hypothetical protein